MNKSINIKEEIRKQIHMSLVNVHSYKDVDLNEYTDGIMRLFDRMESEVREEIRKDFRNLEQSAGEACYSSEGTSGCDEANFYQAMNKELDRYFEEKPKA